MSWSWNQDNFKYVFMLFPGTKKPSKNSWGKHRVAAPLLLEVRHCFTNSVPWNMAVPSIWEPKTHLPYSSFFTIHCVFMGHLSGAPRFSVFHVVLVESSGDVKHACSVWDRSRNPTHTTQAMGQHVWVGSQGSPSWRLCRCWTPWQLLLVATVSQDSGCSIPSQAVELFRSSLNGFSLQSEVLAHGSLSWQALARL